MESKSLANNVFDDVIGSLNLKKSDIAKVVATGFARNSVDFASATITEITCHARGVHKLVPEARAVVEIGGQDSKFLHLDADGTVRDFAMNDRCAAGTGRFLEIVAERFNISFSELGNLAEMSKHPASISSMCVIFAETEIIGLMARGAKREDIVFGIQLSMANRISAMAGRSVTPPIVFTGGVALIKGMDLSLSRAFKLPVQVAPHPQFTGALGAAILATRL